MLNGSCVWGSHQFWALPFFWVSCMIWQTDQSHMGLFFPVLWIGKITFVQPQELFHNFPANSLLARAQCDIARVYVIFLFREHPEFTRLYRHGNQPLEFFLVVNILIVCFDPEYRCSARKKTDPKEVVSVVSRKSSHNGRSCRKRCPDPYPRNTLLTRNRSCWPNGCKAFRTALLIPCMPDMLYLKPSLDAFFLFF